MDKVYYTIDGNTLIIDGEKPPFKQGRFRI